MPRTHTKGFTLVEVLIGTAIFLIFASAVYEGYRAVYAAIASVHHKTLAADLANEKFEILKNLSYTSVGTIGGTPSGVVVPVESVTRDNINFTVTTAITNVDDPFDGSGGSDLFPADYKRAEISIVCSLCTAFKPVTVVGLIAPKSLESI